MDPRLRQVSARGKREPGGGIAGFMQPRDHSLAQSCTLQSRRAASWLVAKIVHRSAGKEETANNWQCGKTIGMPSNSNKGSSLSLLNKHTDQGYRPNPGNKKSEGRLHDPTF